MELVPKIGIGNVRFGMKPSEVIAVFHEFQKYEYWMGGNRNNSFLFHGIILGFDECDRSAPLPDSQLVEIMIHQREDLILWGKPVKDWTKHSLQEYLDVNKIFYQEEHKDEWSFPHLWMSLSFTENEHIDYLEMWTNDEELVPSRKRRRLVKELEKTLKNDYKVLFP